MIGPKNIPAPKRADLKYWYKEARKVIPELPVWQEKFRSAVITVETITFEVGEGTLFIARKRNMK